MAKNAVYSLILMTYFLLVGTSRASAVSLTCPEILDPQSKSLSARILDERIGEKYAKLGIVTSDPEQFLKNMQERYREQKAKDPSHPLDFEYKEFALASVSFVADHLIDHQMELRERLAKLQEKNNRMKTSVLRRFLQLKGLQKEIREVEIALQYESELLQEANSYIVKDSISYRRSLEFFYYSLRALGHFDSRDQTLMTQLYLEIDRAFQGYKQKSIEEEYSMYQAREFMILQKQSSLRGFRVAEAPFLAAVKGADNLDSVVVPVHVDLGRDIFLRLMSHGVHLVGVVADPFHADGFVRPSGDFWMHDIRHETLKVYELAVYLESTGLTDAQIKTFQQMQERWWLELEAEMSQVKDPDLREAIDLVQFNFFHDRGKPVIPSVWKSRDDAFVFVGLLYMLKVSGQGWGYKDVVKNTTAAYRWLDQFWDARIDQEMSFLQSAADANKESLKD